MLVRRVYDHQKRKARHWAGLRLPEQELWFRLFRYCHSLLLGLYFFK